MSDQTRRKILLAEDDPTMRHWMAEALRAGGYEVLEAADGFEAIDRLQTNEPSAVLLDVNMPGMDGLAFLDRLRHMPKRKNLPVIMVTSSDKNEQVLRAANLGIDGYILKSDLSVEKLLEKLQKCRTAGASGVRGPAGGPAHL